MTKKDTEERFDYDAANELTVIGIAARDSDERRKLVRRISPDTFQEPAHSTIWKVLTELEDKKLDYEKPVLIDLLNRVKGRTEYYDLLESARRSPASRHNVEYYVEALEQDALRARLLRGKMPQILESLKDTSVSFDELESLARNFANSFKGARRNHIRKPGFLFRDYQADLEIRKVSGGISPLGYPVFDSNLTEGFKRKRTIVLSGLPGSGKSTFALFMAMKLAAQGRKPLFCCWEMPVQSALDVCAAIATRIELRRIVQGELDDDEELRVKKVVKWLSIKIEWMENPWLDIRKANRSRRHSNDMNLDYLESVLAESASDVVFYDLWERCLSDLAPSEVTHALIRMQELHKVYNVCGILVHQINLKDVEKRPDKRPTRDALKGTGAYVEIADLILAVHRVGQLKSGVADTFFETLCLKQRKGATNWAVGWDWDGARCQITNPRVTPFTPSIDDLSDIFSDANDV